MVIKLEAYDCLEVGKNSFEERKKIKADISKTNLTKNLIVNTKRVLSESNIREQEVYDFMFSVYFSILHTNSTISIRESMTLFKHYTKKELERLPTTSDFIMNEVAKFYEKPATSLPSYKMKRNQVYKNIFKNYKMKDMIMGIAMNVAITEFDSIFEKAIQDAETGKLDQVAMYILAMLSAEQYEIIDSVFAHVVKNGDLRKFDIRFINVLEHLVKSFCLTKGINVEFRKLEEYEMLNELAEESDQRIETLNTEYTKIINDLKVNITDLEKENKELKIENQTLHERIVELEGYEKLRNKSVVLIVYKNKSRFEEFLLKYKPKSVTIIDPFEKQTKLVDVCKNADYVFHMTDYSSHNIFHTLKSINVNSILINKSNIRSLEDAINNL